MADEFALDGVILLRETERAWQVALLVDRDVIIWVPRSLIMEVRMIQEVDETDGPLPGSYGTLVLPAWWAEKEGLVDYESTEDEGWS